MVAGDILELGATLGAKQDVKVLSVDAAGTTITLDKAYTGDTVTANTGLVRRWEYSNNTSRAPGTTQYATNTGSVNDAMHIAIVDEDGLWTGIKGSVLEVFENVSKASDAKDSTGATNYYKDVINSRSKYAWWAAHNSNNTNAGSASNNITYSAPAVVQTVSLVNGARFCCYCRASKYCT